MALSPNPSREAIYLELTASSYRDTGADNNHLQDMYQYVFADVSGHYSRDAFGGFGIPVIGTGVEVTNEGNNQVTLRFTASDWAAHGGSTPLEAWAEYFDESLGGFPSTTQSQSIASFPNTGSTGLQTGTVTGLTNGTTYQFRVTLVNQFNNNTDLIPKYPTVDDNYDWTNNVTGTPQAPSLSIPNINAFSTVLEYNAADGYLEFDYSDNEDDFVVEVRIDGVSTETCTIDCDANVGTSTNPVKIRVSYTSIPSTSIEFRVKATSTTLTDSAFSSWESATEVGLFDLPLCPL